eukprot:CAMPEP_0201478662 /NCGR_PEP_ID=MMETSP0151_2-20130828/3446_1 /ASSEMBLY_ACC=CAM_ASM_000257 /TAXON_ID=200890 /ORGANISM="Paramoeba atlantica, Strain 621/1 / CCAP 1560/9" /LENGTH=154 /DNA_ID=CAMNT_0047859805 /DNA_START=1 /DNA_END=462 /DNA_ORIENTATION=-
MESDDSSNVEVAYVEEIRKDPLIQPLPSPPPALDYPVVDPWDLLEKKGRWKCLVQVDDVFLCHHETGTAYPTKVKALATVLIIRGERELFSIKEPNQTFMTLGLNQVGFIARKGWWEKHRLRKKDGETKIYRSMRGDRNKLYYNGAEFVVKMIC